MQSCKCDNASHKYKSSKKEKKEREEPEEMITTAICNATTIEMIHIKSIYEKSLIIDSHYDNFTLLN